MVNVLWGGMEQLDCILDQSWLYQLCCINPVEQLLYQVVHRRCIVGRYGKQEGLKNQGQKKLHDIGTKFQQKTDVSLHENVPQYEEVGILLFPTSVISVVVSCFTAVCYRPLVSVSRRIWMNTWRPMTVKLHSPALKSITTHKWNWLSCSLLGWTLHCLGIQTQELDLGAYATGNRTKSGQPSTPSKNLPHSYSPPRMLNWSWTTNAICLRSMMQIARGRTNCPSTLPTLI